MKAVFWGSLFIIVYVYIFYPVLVIILGRLFSNKSEVRHDFYPSVSMVVSVYNEETILREKLKNCLDISYPENKIEFIFGSDGSCDETNDILENNRSFQIKSFIFPARRGKSKLLNELVPKATGDIILFSDANSMYEVNAVKKLVPYFADKNVGGVCGKLKLIDPIGSPGGEGESLYWRYENLIKNAEGLIYSVISANGAIFAVKKELLNPLPTDLPINDDFILTLQVLRNGKRVMYEPNAIAKEETSPDMESEFMRKVRIASLNFNAIPEMINLLNPMQGFVAFSLFSHKLLRWFLPLFGISFFVSNLCLLNQGNIYNIFFLIQVIIFMGALLGYGADRIFGRSGPLIPFYYLAMVNLAIIVGAWRSLTGNQKQFWNVSR